MRTIIGLVVFVIVQVFFLPLSILGGCLIAYKQLVVSKRLGVSSTAIEIINGRWTMDRFGLRKDSPTVQLFQVLPNTTVLGQWLALFPLYLLHKIAGKPLLYPTFKEAPEASLANLVTSRTIFFDRLLKRALSASEQFVVMGAGFDTRCYSDLIGEHLTCYELDQPSTQALKKTFLQKATLDTSSVHFVPVDFRTEHWPQKLMKAGYDPTKVTTFLWEGVTLYLAEEEVKNTLAELQQYAAPGSTLVADFYSKAFVSSDFFLGKKALEMTDETFGFGVTFEGVHSQELTSLVKNAALTLGETHYMGSATTKGTWMAVVEILI